MTGLMLQIRLSLRNVFRNRRRSLYALATIATGALGLFAFMGFNRGLMRQYRDNTIRARWGYGQLNVAGYRGKAHAQPWKMWIEDSERATQTLRGLPFVVDVFPRLTANAMLVYGERSIAAQGEGIDGVAEARFFDQLNYVAGGDFRERGDSLVLGKGLADGLGVSAGDRIEIWIHDRRMKPRSAKVTVTGIFHTGSQEFDSRAFRAPLRLVQSLLDTDRLESVAVALTDIERWPAFAAAAKLALPQLEAVPFDELDRVYYRHAVDWLDAQFDFIRNIILLVVFLGSFNVISTTITERIAEIGALRANGESRLAIIYGMGLEAAVLGLLGGALGLFVGWLLCAGPLKAGIAMPPAPGITRSYRIAIELSASDASQVLGLSTMTAIAGCLLPVLRAVRMPIAAALRHV